MRVIGASGLVIFYGGSVPVLPDYGSTAEGQCDATGCKLCIRRNNTWTHDTSTDTAPTPSPHDA